jgi:hypothetical protein
MTHPSKPTAWIASALMLALATSALGLNRPSDPVVATGGDLVALVGTSPGTIVGFRYEEGWIQIPIQVDERVVVDFGAVYDTTDIGHTFLTYADPGTYTGPDTDPLFDLDDELVFMARDAGERALAGNEPAGVESGSGLELTLFDPLTAESAWVYLFRSTTLPPGASSSLVDYQFDLLSGDYKSTYGIRTGPNPENSSVTTVAYAVHFADRWIRDETAVTLGGAAGNDLLDRHKSLFAPGVCGRSEDTFSAGEGAFIVNRSGPVRALRGYLGANSGPFTSRIHAFYEQREDILTSLRVHAINSVVDFFDYSDAAVGMSYFNDLNTAGVDVDGVPDVVVPGAVVWEMLTGDPGTLVTTHRFDTDIPMFDYTSYYEDDVSPATTQCTGDASAYASSGVFESDPIPNTDPYLGEHNTFELTRSIAFAAPNQDVAFAQARTAEMLQPLTLHASPWSPNPTDAASMWSPTRHLTLRPNPARATTHIHFEQTIAGAFEVRAYDASGHLVATPAIGSLPRGPHVLPWQLGELPAGVYWVRARGADRVWRTHRLVRLR